MLTPEEVRALLLPPNTDYIIKHGTEAYQLVEDSYTTYRGVRYHRRLMTGLYSKGGRPYTGIRYVYYFDRVLCYTEFKDGYYFGDDVAF